jgi:hypothetical protein
MRNVVIAFDGGLPGDQVHLSYPVLLGDVCPEVPIASLHNPRFGGII